MQTCRSPAFAAVGEGNLPDEAYAFLKLIQLQKDWAAIGKTVREREDVAGDEWQNVQLYLRKMYQQGEELKGMAKGFAEPKRAQALALVEAVRAEARAADKPAGARDRDAFLAAQRSIEAKIGEFVDLFQDVPDEL
ncbi:hypothetical protein JKP88DRAFT_86003 [Tribonema minus]|uniref:Uncharacterized protein n=1 Tax=Tribonema minus TaxID=303371 RepID=A0A836C9Q5_9STRA|nr:hypothetical protein JKP88DRAFT_86003 [Tribonema minus]